VQPDRIQATGRPPSRASSLPQKSRAKAGLRTPTLFTTHQAER
jgi:hypothetical protein